jgi:uncharacterized protein (TIGR02300 family)
MAGRDISFFFTGPLDRGKPTPPKTSAGTTPLIKADLGTKRICPSCGARFYDLQKRPIECPKCAFTFEPDVLLKQRRTRVPEAVAKPAPVEKAAELEDAEENEDEDAELESEDEEADEVEEAEVEEAPAEAGSESDDEETDTPAPEEPVVTEDDFEEEIEDDEEEDDNLLEEVEEDEDDVSGIIDTDIEKDER